MSQSAGGAPQTLPPGTGALGLHAFLASISILFVSTLCAYWIVRGQAGFWSEGLPAIPSGLWLSTALLVLLSGSSQTATNLFRFGKPDAGVRMFKLGFFLAIGFVVSQVLNWNELSAAHLSPKAKSLYAFSFYMLTGLHVLHVLGGLIWHWIALRKWKQGLATEETVRNTAVYWHFLGVCWAALFFSFIFGAAADLQAEGIVRACWYLTGFGGAMFVICWLKAISAIAKHENIVLAAVAIIPMVAFLRAFMKADEMAMRRTLYWWVIWFGLILASTSVALAISLR